MAGKLTCTAAILIALTAVPHAAAADARDPYEPYNRAMFRFNDTADRYVFAPVARGYRKITPKPVRSAAGNFFNNLRDVKSFGSNLLRGHIGKAGGDFMRVAVNTTFGLGGLINIAGEAGMPDHKNTFGDTLASWGWKKSYYFVLPLLGPSTVRDGIADVSTAAYSPQRALIHDAPANLSLSALDAVNTRERLLDATDALDDMALDRYIAVREAYLAARAKQLGNAPEATLEDELADPEAEAASAPAPEAVSGQPENPISNPAQE